MYKITGILKKEEIRSFPRKDGTQGQSKIFYIAPEGSIYPIKVNVADINHKIGKQGETITIDVEIFPYHIVDSKRKRAFIDLYIPLDKK